MNTLTQLGAFMEQKETFAQSLGVNDSCPNHIQIREQLQRILTSPEFHGTEKQSKFLSYVVLETLSGKAMDIKGYSVATQALGKASDFDAQTDPIVSMHASKLRRALERYYLTEGVDDPVRIEIPKGTYVPTFSEQQVNRGGSTTSHLVQVVNEWPTVIMQPFISLTNESSTEAFGLSIMMEIAVELGRTKEIQPVVVDSNATPGTQSSTGYILSGTLYSDRDVIRGAIQLKDAQKDIQVFGHTFQATPDDLQNIDYAKEIADTIATSIAGENGVINKRSLHELPMNRSEGWSPYDAILSYYAFEQNSSQENLSRVLDALHYTTQSNPNIAHVWSFLARIYAELYSFCVPGFEKCLDKALEFAETGVRLDPNSQRTHIVLAFVHFHRNDLDSARTYLNRAVSIYPDSVIYVDMLGYLFTLIGDWDRGESLIRKAMRVSPNYLPIAHYSLWLNHIRLGNYEKAYIETSGLVRASIFWYSLAKVSTLGLMGKCQEGEKYYNDLLELIPDFPTRGPEIIRYYVKFSELSDKITEGVTQVAIAKRSASECVM